MLFFMVDIQIDSSSSSDDILTWVTHVRGWDFAKYFSMSVAVWCRVIQHCRALGVHWMPGQIVLSSSD